jgi:hypothetical protein
VRNKEEEDRKWGIEMKDRERKKRAETENERRR